MNGWGPSDEGFATREATISDAVEWARLNLELASRRESAEYCQECDEEIPVARQVLVKGVQYCICCQEKYDKINTSYYNRRGSKDSQLR